MPRLQVRVTYPQIGGIHVGARLVIAASTIGALGTGADIGGPFEFIPPPILVEILKIWGETASPAAMAQTAAPLKIRVIFPYVLQ